MTRKLAPAIEGSAPIAVIRHGSGPEVLLVHGGAGPDATWSSLWHLSERWTLVSAYRRGFAPSPEPPGGRHNFEIAASDICELLNGRPHLVGHSYGGIAAAIAAICRPGHVRSLTLIEPALFLAPDDPDVAELRRMGEEVLAHGLNADRTTLRRFLKIAGAPVADDEPLPEGVVRSVRRAQGTRPPSEARPSLHLVRKAGIPSLVASGDRYPALERMCDAVAIALGAQRVIAPGAGHFVAAAPGFADQLECFLTSRTAPRPRDRSSLWQQLERAATE